MQEAVPTYLSPKPPLSPKLFDPNAKAAADRHAEDAAAAVEFRGSTAGASDSDSTSQRIAGLWVHG